MRQYSTPATYKVPATGSLTDDLLRNAADHGDDVVMSRRSGSEWHDVTASTFLSDVQDVARGLLAAGVEHGDRVVLISRTRYEWTVVDYAIWYVGAVTVPIYETSARDQIAWILDDSEAVVAVVETSAHADLIRTGGSAFPLVRNVICLDEGDLDPFTENGRTVTGETLAERRSAVVPGDMATLIYTSGTTGRPKGCVLTHANFMFELGTATTSLDKLFERPDASTLLFLPLAHIFARIIQVGCVQKRVKLGHSADIKNLVDDLGVFQPTFVLAVPRVFEKVFNTASQRAAADGRGRVFDAATNVAVAYSQAGDRSGPGPFLRAKHKAFDRLVYAKLRAVLGGQTAFAISGGAPLGERLAHFFRGIGVPVLEGYGLTETTAALTVNLPDQQRVGTVGPPLPGTSVRVSDDGELAFKGGQIFAGYWKDPEATADVLDEAGWFRTGDLGEVDEDGFVRITGRKKEILVTAGGKNVAPAVLEDRIRAHALVSQVMVVGDGKPFVGALVTIDSDAVKHWAQQNGKKGTISALYLDDDLRAEIQHAIDDANAAVSRAEAIRKFVILPVDWSEETGELTPTMKLKRTVVMRTYHDEVEGLYQ